MTSSNISVQDIPRELADKVSPQQIEVLRKEGNTVVCLSSRCPADDPFERLRKIMYDAAERKIIEDYEWKRTDLNLPGRIFFTAITAGLLFPAVLRWWTQDKREDYQKTREWNKLCDEFRRKNEADEKHFVALAAPIRLYQGSIDEVERDLNMRLKRIDTQTSETFLYDHEALNLRARAAQLGANAIVHYRTQRHGEYHDEIYHIGTPVKPIGPLYHSPHDIIVEEMPSQAQ